jgi:hypothetical protein
VEERERGKMDKNWFDLRLWIERERGGKKTKLTGKDWKLIVREQLRRWPDVSGIHSLFSTPEALVGCCQVLSQKLSDDLDCTDRDQFKAENAYHTLSKSTDSVWIRLDIYFYTGASLEYRKVSKN